MANPSTRSSRIVLLLIGCGRLLLCASALSFHQVVGRANKNHNHNLNHNLNHDDDNDNDRRNFLTKSLTGAGSAAAVLLGDTRVASAASRVPSVGVRAPEFSLMNSKGALTDLGSLTKPGKWTVLYFYPGAFTSGCTLEARGFQRDMDKYRALNAQIVGVSVDSVEKNAQFCNSESLDFFMLSDVGGTVSKLYGSSLSMPGFGTFSNRQTYIIDPAGSVEFVFLDVESRVARHSQEVLEKLEVLTKGGGGGGGV